MYGFDSIQTTIEDFRCGYLQQQLLAVRIGHRRNSRVGVFYLIFLTILATQRLLLLKIKVNRFHRTHARRNKGDYFENLLFMQILFETQQIFALKTSFAQKRHDKYPIF